MGTKRDIIENIFFNEIVNEAKTGEIKLTDEQTFNVGFNTCIKGNLSSGNFGDSKPILMINNPEQLITLLEQYVTECDKYPNIFTEYDLNIRIKGYLTLIWSNAIYDDFANPLSYISRRIDFFKTTLFDFDNIDYQNSSKALDDSKIVVSNEMQDIRNETPYTFKTFIKKDDDSYELPRISYGISNNECYIYAVQNNKNKSENISDVSPSAILALTVFLDMLNRYGIEKIKVISLLPIRYNSKELAFQKKYEYELNSGKLNDIELKKLLLEYKKENLRIQKNLSEKLIRNFRRLEHHFPNCTITSYPMEFDEYLHILVRQFKIRDNDFLNDIINQEKNSISK